MLCIGGSRGGGVPGARHPLWDPILLFSHFHQKAPASEVQTPLTGARPPYGKSWIRHCFASLDMNISSVEINTQLFSMSLLQ